MRYAENGLKLYPSKMVMIAGSGVSPMLHLIKDVFHSGMGSFSRPPTTSQVDFQIAGGISGERRYHESPINATVFGEILKAGQRRLVTSCFCREAARDLFNEHILANEIAVSGK